MAHRSGRLTNLTITIDSGILILAKHRALLDRTTVNRHLANALEDYADGAMDAARCSNSAAYVYAVVEEIRRLKRAARASRGGVMVVQSPTQADLTPYSETDRDRPEYVAGRADAASSEA